MSERRWWNLTPRALPDAYFNRFVVECAIHLGEPEDQQWSAYLSEHIKSGRLFLHRQNGKTDIHLDVYGEDTAFGYRMRWPHKLIASNLSILAP